jgi:hypothetical protein
MLRYAKCARSRRLEDGARRRSGEGGNRSRDQGGPNHFVLGPSPRSWPITCLLENFNFKSNPNMEKTQHFNTLSGICPRHASGIPEALTREDRTFEV